MTKWLVLSGVFSSFIYAADQPVQGRHIRLINGHIHVRTQNDGIRKSRLPNKVQKRLDYVLVLPELDGKRSSTIEVPKVLFKRALLSKDQICMVYGLSNTGEVTRITFNPKAVKKNGSKTIDGLKLYIVHCTKQSETIPSKLRATMSKDAKLRMINNKKFL